MIKEVNKTKILEYLQQALDTEINDVMLVSESSELEGQLVHGIPRIGMLLEGQLRYSVFRDRQLHTPLLKTGDVFYCGKKGYLYCDHIFPSIGLSVCYYGKMIRVTCAEYSDNETMVSNISFNSRSPVSLVGRKLLDTLDEAASRPEYTACIPDLIKALLRVTIEDVRKSSDRNVNCKGRLWVEIEHYLRHHHNEKITQKSLAKKFSVSPNYASYLIKKYSGIDFTSLLTAYRLEHAAVLLRQTYMSVDEIAEQCRFNYTSYFIKRFKQKYGVTPHVFRR